MTSGTLRFWTRRTLLSVTLIAATGCGDDKASDKKDDIPTKDGGESGGDGGDSSGTTGGTERGEPVTDAPNCDMDMMDTPGSDCAAVVTCGGTLTEPHVCPSATHSCCVSGLPSEESVNCFAGTSACQGEESKTPCDGPEDCSGGKVCCVTPPNAKVITECRNAQDCDDPTEGTVFCHTDKDCLGGKTCAPPSIARWWGFCS